jgi:hypothetical protein
VVGAHDHRVDVRQLVDDQAVAVDANRHDLEPRGGDRRPPPPVARILDSDPTRALRAEDFPKRQQRLGRAREDPRSVRHGDRAARARQERRQLEPQLAGAEGLAVGEVAAPGAQQRRARRREPFRTREEREVREARRTGARDRCIRVDPHIGGRPSRRGDRRGGAAAHIDVALGGELRVRADDDAARHPEVRG